MTMQGALDKRILRPVNNVKQILALNSRKAYYKSPGGCDHETLLLELAINLTRIGERSDSQSIDKE